MGTQIEDGELPEEGEIMEEDDELNISETAALESIATDPSEKIITPSRKNFEIIANSRSSSLLSYPKTSKFKDYDAKASAKDLSQDIMLTSWVNGIQRKNKLGCVSPTDDRGDAKSKPQKISEDRDYRRLSSAEGEILDDDDDDNDLGHNGSKSLIMGLKIDNENIDHDADLYDEDTDFRLHINSSGFSDSFGNRRRRRSGSPDIALTKRQRSGFGAAPLSGDEDSPSSSSPQHFNNSDQFSTNFRSNTRGRQAFGFIHNTSTRLVQRWGERTICKFFREGFCRDGDECAFSHNAADSHRRPELCKFYQHGFCKKGLSCLHLHGEYPCKAFHKGECSKEQCQYSHLPLNDFTQPIFDQMMKDEELASRISLPTHPLRRKVLIPQGPESSSEAEHIPPPSIVVPVLSSMPPSQVEEKVMAATGTYGFFNPITPVSISSASSHITLPLPTVSTSSNTTSSGVPIKATIPPPVLLPAVPPPVSSTTGGIFSTPTLNKTLSAPTRSGLHLQPKQMLGLFSSSTTSVLATSSSSNVSSLFNSSMFTSSNMPSSSAVTGISPPTSTTFTKQEELKPTGSGFFSSSSKINSKSESLDLDSSGGFNINLMLERITQQVTGPSSSDIIDDSPASPPNIFSDSMDTSTTKVIPVVRAWKLIPVDVEVFLDTSVDLKLIGQISSGSYRNDPRLRKLAEKQFDLVTKTLEKQSAAATPTSKSDSQELINSGNKSILSDLKLIDPRKLADPRKKAAPSNTSLTINKFFDSVNDFENIGIETNSGLSSDELFQSMVQQQLQMVNQMNASVSTLSSNNDDIDHRSVPSSTPGFAPHNATKPSSFMPGSLNTLRPFGIDPTVSSENLPNESASGDLFYRFNQQPLRGGYKNGFFNNGSSSKREFFNNQSYNIRTNNQDDSNRSWNYSTTLCVSPNNLQQRYSGISGNNFNSRFDQNYDVDSLSLSSETDALSNIESNKTLNKAKLSPLSSDQISTTSLQQQLQQKQQSQLPLAPISLREKRKNNEYESPLARVSNNR